MDSTPEVPQKRHSGGRRGPHSMWPSKIPCPHAEDWRAGAGAVTELDPARRPRGEQVRVTLRGSPLADIVPARAAAVDDRLRELIADDRVGPPARARPGSAPKLAKACRSASRWCSPSGALSAEALPRCERAGQAQRDRDRRPGGCHDTDAQIQALDHLVDTLRDKDFSRPHWSEPVTDDRFIGRLVELVARADDAAHAELRNIAYGQSGERYVDHRAACARRGRCPDAAALRLAYARRCIAATRHARGARAPTEWSAGGGDGPGGARLTPRRGA